MVPSNIIFNQWFHALFHSPFHKKWLDMLVQLLQSPMNDKQRFDVCDLSVVAELFSNQDGVDGNRFYFHLYFWMFEASDDSCSIGFYNLEMGKRYLWIKMGVFYGQKYIHQV